MTSTYLDEAEVHEAFGELGIEVGELLGQGRFASVYSARFPDDDGYRDVALRIIPLRPGEYRERGADDSGEGTGMALSNLFVEYSLATGHDSNYVVEVFDAGVRGPFYYMVLEPGDRTFAGYEPGELSVEEIERFFLQGATGLLDLEEQRIVHGDIKPGNLLRVNGNLKITDLGTGFRNFNPPSVGMMRGTPNYLPPEGFAGVYSGKTDVYGLAQTMYELIAGSPFTATDSYDLFVEKGQGVPDIREKNPRVPDELAKIIMQGLYPDAELRSSIYQMWYDLSRRQQRQPTSWSSLLNTPLQGARRGEHLSSWNNMSELMTFPPEIEEEKTDTLVLEKPGHQLHQLYLPRRGTRSRFTFELTVEPQDESGYFALVLASEDYGPMTVDDVLAGDFFGIEFEEREVRMSYGKYRNMQAERSILMPRKKKVTVERHPDRVLFQIGDDRIVRQLYLPAEANRRVWLSAEKARVEVADMRAYYDVPGHTHSRLYDVRRSFAEGDFPTAASLAERIALDAGDVYTPETLQALLFGAKSNLRMMKRTGNSAGIGEVLGTLDEIEEQGSDGIETDAGIEHVYALFFLGENYASAYNRLLGMKASGVGSEVIDAVGHRLAHAAPPAWIERFESLVSDI